MHHQHTPSLVVLGDSPLVTSDVDPDDITTLGDLTLPHTRSPRVAHHDRDSPPPGGAPPITHIASSATDGPMASTAAQCQPEALSFTANDRIATAAVAVMTTVVVTLAVAAASAVVSGSADWLSVAAAGALGIVGLGGICVRPVLRWTMRRQTPPVETGAIR